MLKVWAYVSHADATRKVTRLGERLRKPILGYRPETFTNIIRHGPGSIQKQFQTKQDYDGNSWPITLPQHRKKGWRSTLVVTGRLRDSWMGRNADGYFRVDNGNTVVIGSTVPYAKTFQEGTPPYKRRPVGINILILSRMKEHIERTLRV